MSFKLKYKKNLIFTQSYHIENLMSRFGPALIIQGLKHVVQFILRNIASLCFAVQFWRKNGTIMQQCPVANSRLIDFASREVGKFAGSRLSVANFATFGTTLIAV